MASAVDNFDGTNSIDIGEGRTMELYKAKNVAIAFTNLDTAETTILKSFQDGDMASFQKANNKIDPMADPQGAPAAAVSYDALGTATVTVQVNSPTDRLLSDAYNNDTMFGLIMTDRHSKVGGNHCMINKAPDDARGKSVPMHAYTIEVFDYKFDANAEVA